MSGDAPRVLMVVKRSGGLGGMQVQAGRVSLRLLEMGVPVSLLTRAQDPGDPPAYWTERVERHDLPDRGQWQFAKSVYRFLTKQAYNYDVVHVHGFGPETFAAMSARRRTGKPLVVKPSTAGPGTKLHAYARWFSALPAPVRGVWQRVDAWASISGETRADLERLGVPPERIADIPNGVDTRRHHPLAQAERAALRAELGIAPEEVLICCAARLAPHKRVDLLIRAFSGILDTIPGARLWIAGYGEERDRLEALRQNLPGGERVRLLGKVRFDEMCRTMQAADMFALLSRWEGLSNALLEAMACGLPCVVSDVSGMSDVVRHEATGLVVPPDDERTAREVLALLAADPALRTRLGAEAARTIVGQYSLDQTCERLLGLYARLHRTAVTRTLNGMAK
jgi:glycosyltransferase involved in cell wall biosynthesis